MKNYNYQNNNFKPLIQNNQFKPLIQNNQFKNNHNQLIKFLINKTVKLKNIIQYLT